MSLAGGAFLMAWTDVDPAIEKEFNRWYNEEHVPERVGIPGFLAGRRYLNRARQLHRYCALYEVQDLAVLASSAYLARLNAPTPWTGRIMPRFRNFVRGACRILATGGRGLGGSLVTLRIDLPAQGAALAPDAAQRLVQAMLTEPGVVAAHVGVQEGSVSRLATLEQQMRVGSSDPAFGAVVLVEGTSSVDLEAVLPKLESLLQEELHAPAVAPPELYGLGLLLTAADLFRAR